MPQQYEVAGRILDVGSPELQGALSAAYNSRGKVFCRCDPQLRVEISMRLTQRGIVLARRPNTASQHAAECLHSAAHERLTGLHRARRAIEERADGRDILFLGVSLSTEPTPRSSSNGSGGLAQSRMTLRGLEHLLWTNAGLVEWSPAYYGRRGWKVVRDRLLEAAIQYETKWLNLERVLFIPEYYEPGEEQLSRRKVALSRVTRDPSLKMIIIAELRQHPLAPEGAFSRPSNDGSTLVNFRHFRDDFRIPKKQTGKFGTLVRSALRTLSGTPEVGHLMLVGTFSRDTRGFVLHDFLIQAATTNWLLVDSPEERELIEFATNQGWQFKQGLRYDADKRSLIANVSRQIDGQTQVFTADEQDWAAVDRFKIKCQNARVMFVSRSANSAE